MGIGYMLLVLLAYVGVNTHLVFRTGIGDIPWYGTYLLWGLLGIVIMITLYRR